jgi:hypothetical protein
MIASKRMGGVCVADGRAKEESEDYWPLKDCQVRVGIVCRDARCCLFAYFKTSLENERC